LRQQLYPTKTSAEEIQRSNYFNIQAFSVNLTYFPIEVACSCSCSSSNCVAFFASPPADAVPRALCMAHAASAASRATSTAIVQMHGDDASSKFLARMSGLIDVWASAACYRYGVKERYNIKVAGRIAST
jgi:hypothetical protein